MMAESPRFLATFPRATSPFAWHRRWWIMNRLLMLPAIALLVSPASFGFADPPEMGVIKDTDGYLFNRKWAPLPGKVVGVLLPGGREIHVLDGWTGPADVLVFASG